MNLVTLRPEYKSLWRLICTVDRKCHLCPMLWKCRSWSSKHFKWFKPFHQDYLFSSIFSFAQTQQHSNNKPTRATPRRLSGSVIKSRLCAYGTVFPYQDPLWSTCPSIPHKEASHTRPAQTNFTKQVLHMYERCFFDGRYWQYIYIFRQNIRNTGSNICHFSGSSSRLKYYSLRYKLIVAGWQFFSQHFA